ncbi:MBOAT family protein [Flagellimonas sp. 389]|uniref:MBOAT family O-acyltransferase n=1 Tax=Flagellimonas sp. 389 TaxID=2835862 RepID=UPI002022F474|nr:MBOAT family O-acyltransferase [Flagellimonas sp. 389]
MGLSILVNIGLLFTFKYLSFFTSSISQIFNYFGLAPDHGMNAGSYSVSDLILPIGISFYTFQTLSYSIDVYRGTIVPEKHLGRFALFVAFFPQLVAGPIERAGRLLPQFKERIIANPESIKKGLILIAWGFFLKVVVADRLGVYVDGAHSDPELYHGLPLLISTFFFPLQLYYDFSAYTAIAIGVAHTMGYNLMHNFNKPLFATSSASFWNRWHISFMLWLKDYLYKPMGGYIVKKPILIRNVLIIFFIVGLWHGANWTFVIWGLLSAFLLIVEAATSRIRRKVFSRLGIAKGIVNVGGWIITMSYLMFSLVFFRSPSIEHALLYLENMFLITNLHINILGNYFELGLCFLLILSVQWVHFIKGNNRIHEFVINKPLLKRWTLYTSYIIIIVLFAINRQHTFIYFQF